MSKTADVIVIGAGIMGCCTAFELAKRGVKVIVLERGAVGSGATGRSSSIIRQHYSHELTTRMALHSLRVFQNFEEIVGGDCSFERTGWVAIVPESDKDGLAANVAMHQSLGVDTRLIGSEDLAELAPLIDATGVVAAAYESESGHADPHLTVTAFAEAAKRHGAQVLSYHEVTAMVFTGDRISAVETSRGTFEAPIVINCTGPWIEKVARMANLELPIVPVRIQVAFFRRPEAFDGPHPVMMDLIRGIYLRSETGRLTLAGRIDPAEADDVVDPDDFGEHADREFVSYVGERFLECCPALEDSEYTTGFSSLYAVTPDWHPIIDELPEGSGHFVCSGFSGHGFKLGPAVGVMTTDLIQGVADPEFPADLFRFGRFEENAMVKGNYEYSIVG